jgi:hypothetical protein
VVLVKILHGSWPKGRGSAPVVVSEHEKNSFLSVAERKEEKFSAMPLRRRDRKIPDPSVEREMCDLRARLDAMEIS